MYTYLQTQWQLLADKYNADTDLVLDLWQQLATAYSHPARHYHNLHHLGYMLQQLYPHQQQLSDFDTVAFAVYFHDVVYSVTRSDNEAQSAEVATMNLRKLGMPEAKIAACTHLILATQHHAAGAPDADANYLIDSDLAILGEEWALYEKYTRQIRKEYSLYPDMVYKPGRR
ncbi:hypothetical protein ACMA1I_09965 [Pontibacter sp. 13R65]|uniref:HD domain-containing protein n=1 Tax=Pontibacter sp. 13R65 TaxID=3127458 RepID=UPI00301C6999